MWQQDYLYPRTSMNPPIISPIPSMIREIDARLSPPALTVPIWICDALKMEVAGTYGESNENKNDYTVRVKL